mgnify:CR=1 FL=1
MAVTVETLDKLERKITLTLPVGPTVNWIETLPASAGSRARLSMRVRASGTM